MTMTLEQQAHFLYLESRYPVVVILGNDVMYGAESLADAERLLMMERDWLMCKEV